MPVSGPTYMQVTGSPTSGGPNVTGATSSTNNALPRWDGTSGADLKNSGVLVDDSNNVSGIANLLMNGKFTTSGVVGSIGMLKLNGNTLGSTSQYNIDATTFTSTSAATSSVIGVLSGATTVDAAFTCASQSNFYSQNIAKGAASTITRRYGIYLDTPTGASTANVVIANGTGAPSDHFIYSTNTAPSVLAGQVAISGTAVNNIQLLRVGGVNILSGISQYGVASVLAGTSAATSSVLGFFGAATTADAAFTTGMLVDFYSNTQPKGASSTITRRSSFAAGGIPSDGTNNCLLTDSPSTFSAGNWGVYLSSTNSNYFSGPIRMTTTVPMDGGEETLTVYHNATPGTTQMVVNARGNLSGAVVNNSTMYAINGRLIRTATANLSESGTRRVIVGRLSLQADAGVTYTNTASIGGVASLTAVGPDAPAGTLAVNYLAGISVVANSIVTGPNKYALYLGDWSGGTNSNWQIYSDGTSPSYLAGPVRIGTTAQQGGASTEALTVYQAYNGTASDPHNALTSSLSLNTNTALSGAHFGMKSRFQRYVTTDVTDTSPGGAGQICNLVVASTLSAGAGSTYTYSDTEGFAELLILNPGVGAGTLALSNYSKIRLQADSAVTGINKYGIYIADQSGATNNWAIYAPGSTNQSYHEGTFRIGSSSSILSSTEKLGVKRTYTGTANDSCMGLAVNSYIQTNDALTSGNGFACYFRRDRVITGTPGTVTDSPTGGFSIAGVVTIAPNFSVPALQTYAISDWADLNLSPSAAASGTLALDYYYHLRVATDNVAVTGRKYGIYVSNITGGTLTNYGIYCEDSKSSFGGALCTRKADVASAASITSLDSARTFVKLTGSTATTLHGIAAGKDGQKMTLFNNTGQNLTIKHQSGTAAAADQITTMTGADVVSTGNCCAEFIYDATDSKWINVSVNP